MVARIGLNQAPKAKIYLAEWRETKFATQQELADAMNTTAATVSRIETGERDWSRGYLEALAYLVDCKVADLFQHPDKTRNKPSFEELMSVASSLSEDRIAGLVAFLREHEADVPQQEPSAANLQAQPARAK